MDELPPKPTWDEYYLGIAQAASARSSCVRAKVGAVVVNKGNRIVSVGYNDSPPGKPGCEACPRRTSTVPPGSSYDTGPGACVSLHAEQNAIIHASGDELRGSTIYITRAPCDGCRKIIQGAQVSRVVFPEGEMTL